MSRGLRPSLPTGGGREAVLSLMSIRSVLAEPLPHVPGPGLPSTPGVVVALAVLASVLVVAAAVAVQQLLQPSVGTEGMAQPSLVALAVPVRALAAAGVMLYWVLVLVVPAQRLVAAAAVRGVV